MTDDARGESRTLYTVLQDSPEFANLTSDAQNVFRAVKLTLPLAGINVCHPGELLPRCGRDMTPARLEAALRELEDAGFIRRDGAVLWLRNGLRFEPFIKAKDWKHRAAVQRRLASLPRVPLLAEFRRHYPDFMAPATPGGAPVASPNSLPGSESPTVRGATDPATADADDDAGDPNAPMPATLATYAQSDPRRADLVSKVFARVLESEGTPDERRARVSGYAHTIAAALDGMQGGVSTPDDMDCALLDWLTNAPPLGLRAFRNYLAGTRPARGKTTAPRAATAPTAGQQALLKVI